MATYNNQQRKEPINVFMNKVHQHMKTKYQLQGQVAKDKVDAQRLQAYFTKIKNPTYSSDLISGALQQDFQDLVQATFLLQKASGSKVRNANNLFRRAHGSIKTQADDIFEEELYYVIKALEQESSNNVISSGASLIGGETANIKIEQEISKDIKKIMNNLPKRVANHLQEKCNNIDIPWSAPVARAQKIDNTGTLSTVNVEASIKPEWQDFFRLLQGATFSAKNYATGSWRTDEKGFKEFLQDTNTTIGLGSSDIYKAFYGAMSSLGYDPITINSAFVRAYNSSMRKNKSVSSHFYHLRFLYELTGAGLVSKSGKPVSPVKFLIYNDPSGDNIYVRSTSEIIYDMLNSDNYKGNPFSGIKIEKSYFKTGQF